MLTETDASPETVASLTTKIINPLIQATTETFEMMLQCEAKRSNLSLLLPEHAFHPITAVIGLTGAAAGTICLNFPPQTAFQTVKRILDIEKTEVDALVCDAVGEFANVIVGCAKDKLVGLDLEIGIPSLITGEKHEVLFPSQTKPMVIEFSSELGNFSIMFGFVGKG